MATIEKLTYLEWLQRAELVVPVAPEEVVDEVQ